jgi:hypothetical protein
MAKSSRVPETVKTRREAVSAQSNEPIRTFERSVVQHHTSLYANLPHLAREQLEVEAGDEITVEVFDDRVVIHQ